MHARVDRGEDAVCVRLFLDHRQPRMQVDQTPRRERAAACDELGEGLGRGGRGGREGGESGEGVEGGEGGEGGEGVWSVRRSGEIMG